MLIDCFFMTKVGFDAKYRQILFLLKYLIVYKKIWTVIAHCPYQVY